MAAAAVLATALGTSSAKRAGSFDSDLTLWESAFREQPGALFAAWSLSDELGGAARRAEALAVLVRLESTAPDPPTRLRARALIAFHERRLDAAAQISLQAWQLRPAYSFQGEMGNLLLRAGRADLAVRVLTPLVGVAPRYSDARVTLARALTMAGRNEEGIRTLAEGIALDPGDNQLAEALRDLVGRPP